MDVVLSLMAIIVLLPILGIVAILVRFKLGSPVLFKQERPGLNEKIFRMYKFRTMTDEKDEKGELLSDSIRLTKFGKFLRSTSLDELPELFNILKGDMSIVGPRPQLIDDMFFMSELQRSRHNVLPGLTGWAQVNGRNSISWEDKLSLDLDYIRNISLLYDIKIVFLTIKKVFEKDGVTMDDMDTADDYGVSLLKGRTISQEEFNLTMQRIQEFKKNGNKNG